MNRLIALLDSDACANLVTALLHSLWQAVAIADKSIDDFVIDLSEQAQAVEENIREVVLDFEVPAEAPLPEGEIRVNSNYSGNHVGISQMYPIEEGQVKLEVSVPGQISYDLNWSQGPRIAGYWIERSSRIDVPTGDGSFFVGIPLHPAGAIYGQVLEADGTPAKDVSLHLMVIEKAPVMKRSFLNEVFGHDKSELGKFNASPLPLGGEYVVVARRDSTFAVSKPIKKNEKTGDWASADDNTGKDGKFQFSRMGKRVYRLYVPGADIVNRKRTDTVTGGQTENVILRVNLAQWCELKPRKPSGKND